MIKITEAIIAKTLPQCKKPLEWANALNPAAEKYQINTLARLCSFIAQTGHESEHYNRLEENLHYRAPRLMQVWKSRFPTLAKAEPYAGHPERLANLVYANRMGNGDTASGDGYRFRGRGIMQLTGRSNYHQASAALGVDLLANPDLLLQPTYAALSAAWFWSNNGLNALADDKTDDSDTEDFEKITIKINGSTDSAKVRLALYNDIASNFG